ncbi:beta-ketoacyl-[acyl-carrier-protein] synthase family protein [Frigoriglobus tundricola]|uniref:3-oxoacyl-[acyl-carrier-protein] synthase 2 n=1 Tax=Frigoriglobus tundricola TaxID=2774151 RepID=A0A6M5Z550_9BACT|nr:beta-ketoacyl-ACP synthase II [Frigoriglobus tundricola]QJX00937.1 3-oxoacyl-[acyl-carrier-protein] synthase, KASII [Frigoriglobus tundricola]
MHRSRRRVVVTGMGLIAPTGLGVAELFASQVAGRSGVRPITLFDARNFPTRIAGEVTGFDAGAFIPDPHRYRHCDRGTLFALAAAHQAVAEAGLAPGRGDPTRRGVYTAAEGGGGHFSPLVRAIALAVTESGALDTGRFFRAAQTRFDSGAELEQEAERMAGHLAAEFEFDGPNMTCQTACAAAAQAIGESAELIRADEADVMLAGGAQCMIHPFGVTGFCRLTALSKRNDAAERASRPFDRDRDGFVLGEGAGFVVLEESEHARRRGANILAELTGYGTTADAYRMTDPPPDGRGAAGAMRLALRDAGLNADQIGYVNAHGTSTPAGDAAESRAIRTVFGPAADRLAVSSSKSMIGHLVAAGGGVELAICVMALRNGVLPPTINYETPDPDCDLDYVPNQAREVAVVHVLSNNFGFGGQNVSLVVSRWSGG